MKKLNKIRHKLKISAALTCGMDGDRIGRQGGANMRKIVLYGTPT